MKWIGLLSAPAAPELSAPHVVWPAEKGAVICAWPRDAAESDAVEAQLTGLADPLLRVREVVHWDELGEPDAGTVALVCFVRRHRDLCYAEFESYYRERHAPLAREQHPGIARYVHNFLAEPGEDVRRDFDAVSELWFRSEADSRERFYRDADSQRIVAEDVARFLDPRAGKRRLTRPGAPASPRS